jgi:hypothetical protein
MSPEPAHLPPAEWRSHARAQCAVFAACRFLAAGGDNVGIGHWRTCCVNSEGCHLEYKCGRAHPTTIVVAGQAAAGRLLWCDGRGPRV